VVGHR